MNESEEVFSQQKISSSVEKQIEDAVTPSGEDHVKSWLKKHGVALEMKVAGAFRKQLSTTGIWSNVDHSRNYVDRNPLTDDATLRESDVVVRMTKRTVNNVWVSLWLIAECKSSSKDAWVLYRGSWDAQPSPLKEFEEGWEIRKANAVNMTNVEGWTETRLLNSTHLEYCYSATSTNDSTQPKKGQSGNAKNYAREAILQVLSAVKGVAADTPITDDHLTVAIFVPIVITSAPLFVVTLQPNGDYEVKPTTRELLVGRFTAENEFPRAVWIINEADIDNFAIEYKEALTHLIYRD